ncbi:hypothetical protein PUR28_17675 [Streptomyces sp. BE308]|uniref:hypothetical protein n=1 Tax=Streptomyces sp. BE308 TaxID=3002529 RepID=UPI002E79515C|nr:hypothetical protein [Streptomyces sp. BE308]MEE1792576.1 hypothetical protein [Streptomyces sp. BE308]
MGSEAVRPDSRTDGTRVRDVVRDVVAEVAPEELPLVAGLVGVDDATAVRRLGGHSRRRETLGFGLGEVAVLVTPVVWLAVDQVAQRIVGASVDGAVGRAGSAMRKLFRRPAVVTVPPLTREQLAEVRESVMETAAHRGLEKDRASTIADAVVARLALAGPERPGPGASGQEGPAGAAGGEA